MRTFFAVLNGLCDAVAHSIKAMVWGAGVMVFATFMFPSIMAPQFAQIAAIYIKAIQAELAR